MPNETQDAADWAAAAEARLLDQAMVLASHDGWTWPMVRKAGRAIGLSGPETELLVPHGPADLAALLSRRHDASTLQGLPDPAELKMRERIRAAVYGRLAAAETDEAAVRRWAGYLALPPNLPLATRLLWSSADVFWRWAGDVATDENHYSKRAILSGILASALAIQLSSGRQAARDFVDGRIENVMAYEKWKAGLRSPNLLPAVASALSRLRYGGGSSRP